MILTAKTAEARLQQYAKILEPSKKAWSNMKINKQLLDGKLYCHFMFLLIKDKVNRRMI